ncbi:hypothetical protein QJS04_geneDACA003967 [Acorus gramineus]|uniref:Uncharacterized protein n=1 Tax=Acorus gramineus TaxID=55184 RepID=A0AAV9BK26_ACOGR|nr:hypothetical protein QJS04_geneDACA003967 [Acorus gramineus]
MSSWWRLAAVVQKGARKKKQHNPFYNTGSVMKIERKKKKKKHDVDGNVDGMDVRRVDEMWRREETCGDSLWA